MSVETIQIDAKNFYGDFHIPDPFMEMKDGFEDYWQWPNNLGSGIFYLIKFRPGMILTILKFQSQEPLSIVFERGSRCFSLSYMISGRLSGVFSQRRSTPQNIILNPGKSYITYMPGYHGTGIYPMSTSLCSISVFIEPWLMKDFLQEQECHLDACDMITEAEAQKKIYHSLPIPPLVNMRLHDILSCYHRGRLKKLFLEGKTLELIALSLSQLFTQKKPEPCQFLHPSHPPDFVHKARDILIGNMQDPPSMPDLCRQIGVNKNKLNGCFRKTYGTSVFDYLRICRLERSRELLTSGEKGVTEVALEVGYSQQSSFTREFKKYFGTSPRDHL